MMRSPILLVLLAAVAASALTLSVSHVSTNVYAQQLDQYDVYLVDASTGSLTLTFASIEGLDGAEVDIRRVDSAFEHCVTVAMQSGETFGGSPSRTFSVGQGVIGLVDDSDVVVLAEK